MGQRVGLTKSDLGKLFKMYNCDVDVNKVPVDKNGIVLS